MTALAGLVRAEPPGAVLELLQNAADALTNEDARTFSANFDRNMPGYAALRDDIEGTAGRVRSRIHHRSSE